MQLDPSAAGLALTVLDAGLSVRAGGVRKAILDGVRLRVSPGEFVAVLGASGSGKSTLVRAVAGTAQLTAGEVRLDGRAADLAARRLDRRIAYLPQDVVLHEPLPAALALSYVARLKGLTDDPGEARRLALAALTRVGLAERADVAVARLSGGQRKRAALASELLGHPQLLLLDEATSGLDPATDGEMMRLFRSLADEGRTVVCVTHSPDHLRLCDRLVVMAGGCCVFQGAPSAAPAYFGAPDLLGVYARLAERPAGDWPAVDGAAFVEAEPAVALADSQPPILTARPPFKAQFSLLLSRYARLQRNDARALLLQSAVAPAVALMVAATFGSVRSGFAERDAADAKQVMFVLALAVLWCAGSGSAREVVKEVPLVAHERRFGLDLRAYLLSKFAFLGAVASAQALVLLGVVRSLTDLPGPALGQSIVLVATALAGVGLGLLVSSAAGTSERAMTVLPAALIGLAIFSGGLARLTGPPAWIARLASPAYWSLDGLKAQLPSILANATYPGAPGAFQPPILGGGGPLASDVAALAAQSAALLAIARFALERQVLRYGR